MALSIVRASPIPSPQINQRPLTTAPINSNNGQPSNAQLVSQIQNSNQALAAAIASSTINLGQQVAAVLGRQIQGWSRL